MNCIVCHGGVSDTDEKEKAHEGMVREPDSSKTCALCHDEIARYDAESLHSTLRGYETTLRLRSDEKTWPVVEKAFQKQCTACHTTCGQCHVSRPTNLGGGLVAAHNYKKVPPMNLSCTGCHGSRIEDEYKGKNEGIKGDVHWIKAGMPCFDCHSGDDLHGRGPKAAHRYDHPPRPGCTDGDCHADMKLAPEIRQHDETHLSKMSCATCHAQDYKHCYSCHVFETEEGKPYFKSKPSTLTLKIGRNPLKSVSRPWDYVLLRHVPVDRDTFAFYGDGLLPNFDAKPTWTYATPHNIQAKTPQNSSCEACHESTKYFLMEKDVPPEERAANAPVIVRKWPIPYK